MYYSYKMSPNCLFDRSRFLIYRQINHKKKKKSDYFFNYTSQQLMRILRVLLRLTQLRYSDVLSFLAFKRAISRKDLEQFHYFKHNKFLIMAKCDDG